MPVRSTANCSTVAAPRHCCYLNMFTVNPVTAAAMVDLLAQYEQHGLQLNSRELPDHLPLYLSTRAAAAKRSRGGFERYCADSGIAECASATA